MEIYMKYFLKAALVLVAINSINAADDKNERTAAPSYFTMAKKTLINFSFKAANFSTNTFNVVKTKSAPYLAIYSTARSVYSNASFANKAHTYLTSETFKQQSKDIISKVNTPKGYKVIAGTAITVGAGYGLYKYFDNNLQ